VVIQIIMVALVIAFPQLVGSHQTQTTEDTPLIIELPTQ
jgi:hypothetical protein